MINDTEACPFWPIPNYIKLGVKEGNHRRPEMRRLTFVVSIGIATRFTGCFPSRYEDLRADQDPRTLDGGKRGHHLHRPGPRCTRAMDGGGGLEQEESADVTDIKLSLLS